MRLSTSKIPALLLLCLAGISLGFALPSTGSLALICLTDGIIEQGIVLKADRSKYVLGPQPSVSIPAKNVIACSGQGESDQDFLLRCAKILIDRKSYGPAQNVLLTFRRCGFQSSLAEFYMAECFLGLKEYLAAFGANAGLPLSKNEQGAMFLYQKVRICRKARMKANLEIASKKLMDEYGSSLYADSCRILLTAPGQPKASRETRLAARASFGRRTAGYSSNFTDNLSEAALDSWGNGVNGLFRWSLYNKGSLSFRSGIILDYLLPPFEAPFLQYRLGVTSGIVLNPRTPFSPTFEWSFNAARNIWNGASFVDEFTSQILLMWPDRAMKYRMLFINGGYYDSSDPQNRGISLNCILARSPFVKNGIFSLSVTNTSRYVTFPATVFPLSAKRVYSRDLESRSGNPVNFTDLNYVEPEQEHLLSDRFFGSYSPVTSVTTGLDFTFGLRGKLPFSFSLMAGYAAQYYLNSYTWDNSFFAMSDEKENRMIFFNISDEKEYIYSLTNRTVEPYTSFTRKRLDHRITLKPALQYNNRYLGTFQFSLLVRRNRSNLDNTSLIKGDYNGISASFDWRLSL